MGAFHPSHNLNGCISTFSYKTLTLIEYSFLLTNPNTAQAPIKDVASTEEIFFEPIQYGLFHLISFTFTIAHNDQKKLHGH